MQKDDHTLAREYLEAGAPFRADSDFVDKDLVKKAGAKWGVNPQSKNAQGELVRGVKPGWWVAEDERVLIALISLHPTRAGKGDREVRPPWRPLGLSEQGVAALRQLLVNRGVPAPNKPLNQPPKVKDWLPREEYEARNRQSVTYTWGYAAVAQTQAPQQGWCETCMDWYDLDESGQPTGLAWMHHEASSAHQAALWEAHQRRQAEEARQAERAERAERTEWAERPSVPKRAEAERPKEAKPEKSAKCPACSKRFANEEAMCGHLADKQDAKHREYRLAHPPAAAPAASELPRLQTAQSLPTPGELQQQRRPEAEQQLAPQQPGELAMLAPQQPGELAKLAPGGSSSESAKRARDDAPLPAIQPSNAGFWGMISAAKQRKLLEAKQAAGPR